jgi:hypothetical protein
MKYCNCEDEDSVFKNYPELFKWIPPYGWVINWVELTEEKGYTQVHRYALPILYCPLCGGKLKTKPEQGE